MTRSDVWEWFWVPAIGAGLLWFELASRLGRIDPTTPRPLLAALVGGIVFGSFTYLFGRFVLPFVRRTAARRKGRPLPNEEF